MGILLLSWTWAPSIGAGCPRMVSDSGRGAPAVRRTPGYKRIPAARLPPDPLALRRPAYRGPLAGPGLPPLHAPSLRSFARSARAWGRPWDPRAGTSKRG